MIGPLEAQQRYFPYRATLVAIVSQNSFVLVFVGYRTIIARYVAKRGIAQMCLCETKYQGGYRTFWGECETLLKSIARYGATKRSSIALTSVHLDTRTVLRGQSLYIPTQERSPIACMPKGPLRWQHALLRRVLRRGSQILTRDCQNESQKGVLYPPRRKDYQINSPNIFSGNHRLPITDFSGNCSKLIPPESFPVIALPIFPVIIGLPQ